MVDAGFSAAQSANDDTARVLAQNQGRKALVNRHTIKVLSTKSREKLDFVVAKHRPKTCTTKVLSTNDENVVGKHQIAAYTSKVFFKRHFYLPLFHSWFDTSVVRKVFICLLFVCFVSRSRGSIVIRNDEGGRRLYGINLNNTGSDFLLPQASLPYLNDGNTYIPMYGQRSRMPRSLRLELSEPKWTSAPPLDFGNPKTMQTLLRALKKIGNHNYRQPPRPTKADIYSELSEYHRSLPPKDQHRIYAIPRERHAEVYMEPVRMPRGMLYKRSGGEVASPYMQRTREGEAILPRVSPPSQPSKASHQREPVFGKKKEDFKSENGATNLNSIFRRISRSVKPYDVPQIGEISRII